VTLFEQYPPKPSRRRRPTIECCQAWHDFAAALDHDSYIPWLKLHTFAHSRVPFTDLYFRDVTGLRLSQAEDMLHQAAQMQWLAVGRQDGPLKHGAHSIWTGLLPAFRR
jgi:hypothetical protein